MASLVGMRVCVSGASGLVGRALIGKLLASGHEVVRLVRAKGPEVAGTRAALWDPRSGAVEGGALEGSDAVVHLAGAGIADRRWSAAVKRELVESRVGPTRALCENLAGLHRKPEVLISASATGYYGDPGDEWVNETAPAGQGFLAKLCVDWEQATRPADAAGVRVVKLRTGVVLGAHGGALARMLPIFRAGGGGPVGSGRQWMSWISLEDQVGLILHALGDVALHGPLNAVAPEPVRNAEFAHTLGAVLHRPAVLRAPAFALRLAFGELADAVLLGGVRVRPAAAVESGYGYVHPTLKAALEAELRRA